MKLKKEFPILLIALSPIIYLALIWNNLPDTVPVHWNHKGEIDRYGSKTTLLYIALLMPLILYALFLLIPKIDPKKQIAKMGGKFQKLRFIITVFISITTIYIIYATKTMSLFNQNFMILLVGGLFLIFGNYFKTISPNYFIGIRTPWTLKNETVWKETHNVGGKLWFIGGLTLLVTGLVFSKSNYIVFIAITTILIVVPIIYSYLRFKKITNED